MPHKWERDDLRKTSDFSDLVHGEPVRSLDRHNTLEFFRTEETAKGKNRIGL